jgi:hypothetical protein
MGQWLGCRCDGSELQWARVTLGIHALDLVLKNSWNIPSARV